MVIRQKYAGTLHLSSSIMLTILHPEQNIIIHNDSKPSLSWQETSVENIIQQNSMNKIAFFVSRFPKSILFIRIKILFRHFLTQSCPLHSSVLRTMHDIRRGIKLKGNFSPDYPFC